MSKPWQEKVVSPEKVIKKILPGNSIFLSTGVAEPRTLIKHLMSSTAGNLRDLELIQLVSLGGAVSFKAKFAKKYRLKTFHSGWLAADAVTEGQIDLIPSRLSRIPRLIESGAINIDMAFIQITPPDEAGYSSLGVAVDAARQAMERAEIVVGEICSHIPRTMGDTFVHMDDFDFLVESTEKPLLFDRWDVDEVIDKVAANVASLIEDGSCLSFATGYLFESLGRHLRHKKNLGVHSPFFTDPLMDLVKCGAITNKNKTAFRGKSVTSYALGTKELMEWLHQNPLVEFQGVDVVSSPRVTGLNPKFVATMPARKVDLTGRIAMHIGQSNVAYGMGETLEIFAGVGLSRGGKTICAVTSRNLEGESNILASIEGFPNQITVREALDLIVTEYGVVSMVGRTVRERALSMIDIAHPDDRAELVQKAKEAHLIYADQIFISGAGHRYPADIAISHSLPDGTVVRFRPIRPSDEDGMRKLFYRFSNDSIYFRYFSPIKTMPHAEMQEYVNIDYSKIFSIVGLTGPEGEGTIVAEARYVRDTKGTFADTAFIVDESFQGSGIGSFMYEFLIKIGRQRGIEGFTADVLASNKSMLKVYEKVGFPVKSVLSEGVYRLTIPFVTENETEKEPAFSQS